MLPWCNAFDHCDATLASFPFSKTFITFFCCVKPFSSVHTRLSLNYFPVSSLIDFLHARQPSGVVRNVISDVVSCESISPRNSYSIRGGKIAWRRMRLTYDSINAIFVLFIGCIIYKFMMPPSMCVNLNTCLACYMLEIMVFTCTAFYFLLFCFSPLPRVPLARLNIRTWITIARVSFRSNILHFN
jgi:hypothetical protein